MSDNRFTCPDVEHEYTRSLSNYLSSGGEGPLQQAYELGRRALAGGYGVLDMIYVHRGALNSIASDGFAETQPLAASIKASQFLAESM